MKKLLILSLAAAMIFALFACGTIPDPVDNNTQNDNQAETPDTSYEAPIADEYSPIVDGVLENVSDKVSLSCFYVAWESYQYGNILSLVVSCGWDADINSYSVYLYDIASGLQLTTADLLKVMNVDEAAFLETVRRAAAAKFDTQYGAIAGGDTDEFLTERRDWTLSDENISMDVRTYADGAGKLHVVLPIDSIAGADSYEQVLALDGVGE